MTDQERIVQLEAENAAKDLQIAHLQEQVAALEAQVRHLLGRLAKDSHNSSKPPSSDGPTRRPRSQRVKSERKPGGQPGHPGQTLAQVALPDVEVVHRPTACSTCQGPLEGVVGQVVECRQVQDLPPLRLLVTEHQVEAISCPACQQITRGVFPPEVSAPAQYGRAAARAGGVPEPVSVGPRSADVRNAGGPGGMCAVGWHGRGLGAGSC